MEPDELVNRLTGRTGVPGADVKKFQSVLVDVLIEQLRSENGKVILPGIGTLKTVVYGAIDATHPNIGKITAPAIRAVKFVPDRELIRTVNGIEKENRGSFISNFLKKFKRLPPGKIK